MQIEIYGETEALLKAYLVLINREGNPDKQMQELIGALKVLVMEELLLDITSDMKGQD